MTPALDTPRYKNGSRTMVITALLQLNSKHPENQARQYVTFTPYVSLYWDTTATPHREGECCFDRVLGEFAMPTNIWQSGFMLCYSASSSVSGSLFQCFQNFYIFDCMGAIEQPRTGKRNDPERADHQRWNGSSNGQPPRASTKKRHFR